MKNKRKEMKQKEEILKIYEQNKLGDYEQFNICCSNKNKYQVRKRESNGGRLAPLCTRLIIVRDDQQAVHNWRDFQEIKNHCVGEDWVGIEYYPPQKHLVDERNTYHLWCFPPEYVDLFPMFKEGQMIETKPVSFGGIYGKQKGYKGNWKPKKVNQIRGGK